MRSPMNVVRMSAVSWNAEEQEILNDADDAGRNEVTFHIENILDDDSEFFNALRFKHAQQMNDSRMTSYYQLEFQETNNDEKD